MKNLTKRLLVLMLVLAIALSVFALAACESIDFSGWWRNPSDNNSTQDNDQQQDGSTEQDNNGDVSQEQIIILDQQQAELNSQQQAGGKPNHSGNVTYKHIFVVINSNGGKIHGSFTVGKDGTLIAPEADPTKDGYTFEGWYKDADCLEEWNFETDKVTENITLYAKWEPIPVVPVYVVIDANGGTVTGYFTVNEDGTLNPPEAEPTKDGYIFDGWYKDADCLEEWIFETDKVTDNVTLYAKWTNTVSSLFSYALNEDGESYALTGINVGTENDIVIPSTYNDKPVTVIAQEAFNNCNRIFTSLTIPASIKTIKAGAMNNCNGFESVYFTGDMADWCGIEFEGGANPRQRTYNVYIDNEPVEDVLVIPDGVTRIGEAAFYCFRDLKTVVIPASVKSIGHGAFAACYYIENTYFLGDMADWCSIHFEYPLSNPAYNSENLYINNVLIEGDVLLPDTVTEISDYAFVRVESITSVIIPDSVTLIGSQVFYGCKNLTTVIIGNGVKSIGDKAFMVCRNLTSVTIGSGVESIGSAVFGASNYIEEIRFNGTVEQWGAIEKGRGWCSNPQQVICTDGEIILKGNGTI